MRPRCRKGFPCTNVYIRNTKTGNQKNCLDMFKKRGSFLEQKQKGTVFLVQMRVKCRFICGYYFKEMIILVSSSILSIDESELFHLFHILSILRQNGMILEKTSCLHSCIVETAFVHGSAPSLSGHTHISLDEPPHKVYFRSSASHSRFRI